MDKAALVNKIHSRLSVLYSDFPAALFNKLIFAIEQVKASLSPPGEKWSEKDCILITYGDSIRSPNEKPLKTLAQFLTDFIGPAISHIHILPFFPYSSDDGFSVIDYRKVNPDLGTWTDVSTVGRHYCLIFDLVINHVSRYSDWFRNFLEGKDPGKDYFISVEPGTDLSSVVRPRSLPLLTSFETKEGIRYLWTTFSSDQIDLNFRNPQVLTEILMVFLFYLKKSARIIRLDAIAFLWKKIGTACLHLPQTHEIVKLMHDIKDYIDPGIILLTETNVPNRENLSYFGNGDEADMVYQFSLPPLLLHALYTGNAVYLNRWASEIIDIPANCTFFNFTASHDGIGVRPLEGILSGSEINGLADAIKRAGGYISTRTNSDGTDIPYELNITYFDAMKYSVSGKDDLQVERFICSQTIMMALKGVPAFYIHSLVGTENDYEGVKKSGVARSINRRKWDLNELTALLKKRSGNAIILQEILRRISIRKSEKAFHPDAPQKVASFGRHVFALMRGKEYELLILANLLPQKIMVDPARSDPSFKRTHDLLARNKIHSEQIYLDPYQVVWLKKQKAGE